MENKMNFLHYNGRFIEPFEQSFFVTYPTNWTDAFHKHKLYQIILMTDFFALLDSIVNNVQNFMQTEELFSIIEKQWEKEKVLQLKDFTKNGL